MAFTKTLLCYAVLFAVLGIALSQRQPERLPTVLVPPSLEDSSGDSSESDESDEGPKARMFIPGLTQTTCNYTAEPGLSCASCNQVLYCKRNNVGVLKNCGFLKRYCNNGRCSFFPGSACDATTTEETTTTDAFTTTDAPVTIEASTTTGVSTTTGGP